LTRIFQILATLEHPLKTSSQPRFLFEGAMIRVAGLAALRPIEEILAAVAGSTGSPLAGSPLRIDAGARSSAPVAPAAPQKKKLNDGPAVGQTAAPAEELESTRGRPLVTAGLEEIRHALVAAVTESRPMLGAMLEQAVAIVVDGGTLSVTFGPGDDGLRRMLSSNDSTRAIESLATQALGRPMALRLSGPVDERVHLEATDFPGTAIEPPAPGLPVSRLPSEDQGEAGVRLMERARNDPAVQRLLREFGAQIIDVRPLSASTEETGPTATIEENA
jgi:hypothetical protein